MGGGSTFAFVSGLGGQEARAQVSCQPVEPPYGCNGEWASIYTNKNGAKTGALFITFGADGDPTKATGYFKNVDGDVVDTFTIRSQNLPSQTSSRDTTPLAVTSSPQTTGNANLVNSSGGGWAAIGR